MTRGGYEPHPEPGDSLSRDPGDLIALEENLP
jgi:hypothetical protein